MKNKKFIKKVAQYIELSQEFEKSGMEIFGEVHEPTPISSDLCNTTLTTNVPIYGQLYVTSDQPTQTRAERILENAQKQMNVAKMEAAKADRYDKYLKLREELSFFVNAYLNL